MSFLKSAGPGRERLTLSMVPVQGAEFKNMEIRSISVLHSSRVPFSGIGLCVVLSETETTVRLFHTFSLTEFSMPVNSRDEQGRTAEEGYREAVGACYWPVNDSGVGFNLHTLVSDLRRRVNDALEFGRGINVHTIVKVLSELEGRPYADVEREITGIVKTAKPTLGVKKQALGVRYRIAKNFEARGREAIVLEGLTKLQVASIAEVVDAVRDRLKTKLEPERVVGHTMRTWHKQGLLETV